jgi:hypothetical protein
MTAGGMSRVQLQAETLSTSPVLEGTLRDEMPLLLGYLDNRLRAAIEL